MDTLPTLIFNADGAVVAESRLRENIPVPSTDDDLAQRFNHSLKSGDKYSFRRFCLRGYDAERDDANYIIYPLIGKKWIPFRLAFCEKIITNGLPMTAVFFADTMDRFHPLMSPASPICRDTAGKLLCDILNLRHRNQTSLIPPEALLVFDRFPLIEQSALGLSGDTHSRCDLLLLTGKIFEELAAHSQFGNMKFDLRLISSDMAFGRPENQLIVPCPAEAYIYLTVILGYLLSCLADDHRIHCEIRYLGAGAELTYGIETSRTDILCGGCSNLEDLFTESHNLSSLARIASTIAHLFDLRTDLSINAQTGLLTASVGVGMEKFMPSDFHFSDPYEKISDILREALALLA